jgi:hypothetical protein
MLLPTFISGGFQNRQIMQNVKHGIHWQQKNVYALAQPFLP